MTSLPPENPTKAEKAASHEERKREKIREREEAIQRIEDKKAAKMRERIAAMERLDEDDDMLAAENRPAAAPAEIVVRPAAAKTRARPRHWGVLFSFILFVIAPIAASGWYLWERAAPRYVSYAGFSVRTEEVSSANDLLGNISVLSGSSSSDTDILYKFIQSQELVARVDAVLDLRAMWAKGDPDLDPLFAYHAPGTIEDLTLYWNRMIGVFNDSGTGLIDMTVQAFSPEDAQLIAQMIYDESSLMINRLSAIARDDATGYAREELDLALEQLKIAREDLTRFRNRTQIVDPSASIQSQMGLLSSLQFQLAETLINLDILRQTTSDSDPRLVQAERRINVIETRIQEERNKLGITSAQAEEGVVFADLVAEYERLAVDQQFAEDSYANARAAFAAAVAEARRQNRYLAAHVRPTQAESAEHPRRYALLALVALFSFLVWTVLVLIAYALKDRR